MNDISIFKSQQFGQVRTITEEQGMLFCARDVASALGYKNPKFAISQHCKGGVKRASPTQGGIQEMIFIHMGDVYRLIVRSKLPEADKFERWVFDEILPTIHKTGSYSAPTAPILAMHDVLSTAKDLFFGEAEDNLPSAFAGLDKLPDSVRQIALLSLLASNPRISTRLAERLTVEAATLVLDSNATGISLTPAYPPLPRATKRPTEKTWTATQIAAIVNTSPQRVGIMAGKHGIKTPEYGTMCRVTNRYTGEMADQFRYNEKGKNALIDLYKKI